jgi:hypothetical protein
MKKTAIILLFSIAFLERIVFDLGPNIELVTLTMLLSAAYLGKKESLWLTFSIMLFTDLIIGNTNIFIFTWSGFLIPAIITSDIFRNKKAQGIKKVALGTLAGIGATSFFFLWTNFGVWLLSSMYPKTAKGLLMSYINALPFLRMQAISTLCFVPTGFALVEFAKKYQLEEKLIKILTDKYQLGVVFSQLDS